MLEAYVEKKSYGNVNLTSLGTGRELDFYAEIQGRHHAFFLKSQVSGEHLVLSVE